MTSKTSFFNIGIYKSSVKRFAWGSGLYFIILFISTVLSLFLSADETFGYHPKNFFIEFPVILHGHYIVIPILMAIAVPTVVAVMVFRYVHSAKQSIFVHSLPVSRKAIYISSLLASFTLMLVPIVINGIILIIMTFSHYGNYFGIEDCMLWMGYNITAIFMMFSCAVFSAMLTGNSFAVIVLNIILHSFLFVTVSAFSIMGDLFVYGYAENNIIFDIIIENNFVASVWGFAIDNFRDNCSVWDYAKYISVSAILYTVSYLLYKKRNVENAGNIAGYKVLNVVFKYLVTFFVTIIGFVLFSYYMNRNIAVFAIIIALISIIFYAASEMLLKKTFNVLYSWKGYVGFVIVFAIITGVFSISSFFGYETRVPEAKKIESASMYTYYYGSKEPFTNDSKIIEEIVKHHSELTAKDSVPAIKSNSYFEDCINVHIKYVMKNGKKMTRKYMLPTETANRIMNSIYENKSYKAICEGVDMENDSITDIYLMGGEKTIKDKDSFMKALRSDIENLSYSQINDPNIYSQSEKNYDVTIRYTVGEGKYVLPEGRYIDITSQYKNTIKWLESNISNTENGAYAVIEMK